MKALADKLKDYAGIPLVPGPVSTQQADDQYRVNVHFSDGRCISDNTTGHWIDGALYLDDMTISKDDIERLGLFGNTIEQIVVQVKPFGCDLSLDLAELIQVPDLGQITLRFAKPSVTVS